MTRTPPPTITADDVRRAVRRFADSMRPILQAYAEAARRLADALLTRDEELVRREARRGAGEGPDELGRWWSYQCANALGLADLHDACPRPFLTLCSCRCHDGGAR